MQGPRLRLAGARKHSRIYSVSRPCSVFQVQVVGSFETIGDGGSDSGSGSWSKMAVAVVGC